MSPNFLTRFFDSIKNDESADQTKDSGNSLANINEDANTSGGKLDLAVVAAITAAIATILSNESGQKAPYPGFIVRKIRRLM